MPCVVSRLLPNCCENVWGKKMDPGANIESPETGSHETMNAVEKMASPSLLQQMSQSASIPQNLTGGLDSKLPPPPSALVAHTGSSTAQSEDEPAAKIGFSYAIDKLSADELPNFVKQNDTSLTFPEKLMLMLVHIEKMAAKTGKRQLESIGWTMEGTAFAIQNKEALTSTWLPRFFGHAKYSSFTRKLYRWGFRKINLSLSTMADTTMNPVEAIFGNENFRRDKPDLLKNMRSVTAAKTRSGVLAGADGGNAVAPAGAGVDTSAQLLQLIQGSLAAQASQGSLSDLLRRQQIPSGLSPIAPASASLLGGGNLGSNNNNTTALTPLQQLTLGIAQQQQQEQDNAMIQEYLRVLAQVPPSALASLPAAPAPAPQIAPAPTDHLLGQLNQQQQQPSAINHQPQQQQLQQQQLYQQQQLQQQQQQEQPNRERLATIADMLLRFGPTRPPPH